MLKDNATLLGAIKSKGVPQIFNHAHEANAQNLPCLVLEGEISTADKVLSGEIVNYSGRYRITALAPNRSSVETIADLVKDSLHNKRGIYSEIAVSKMMLETRENLNRDPADDGKPKRYGITLDFDFRIQA